MRAPLVLILTLAAALGVWAQESPSTAAVLKQLELPSVAQRREALKLKIDWQQESLTKKLRFLAQHDSDPLVRERALELRLTNDPEPADLDIMRAMARHDSTGPRRFAIKWLYLSDAPEDLAYLSSLLTAENFYAASAVQALAKTKSATAYDQILPLLATTGHDGWLGPVVPRALIELDESRGRKALLAALVVPDSQRIWITKTLKSLSAADVRSRSIELLTHADPGARRAAAEIIAVVGHEDDHKFVTGAAMKFPEDRALFIHALGGLGSQAAKPFLLRHLVEDPDEKVRQAAAGALVQVLPLNEAPTIESRLVLETSALTMVYLCEILARLGEPKSIASLIELLNDERASDQPLELSSILPYPHNVELKEAAAFAVQVIRGEAGLAALPSLSNLPKSLSPKHSLLVSLWWGHLNDKSPYCR